MSLSKLFHPSTVAVIGASRKEGQVGREVFTNLIDTFPGDVFPVNPKADQLEGLKCYDSVTEIPEEIDLAVIAVPAGIVPGVLRECDQVGIGNVIVVSGGFKEVGEKGVELEREIAQFAKQRGINMIGPNAIGVISTGSCLNATFAQEMALPGNISFMSQSGAFCTAVLDWANEAGLGFNHFVSLGNKAVLDEVDLIREWDVDENTSVILGYLEGIDRGSEFIQAAREVTQTTPIVVVKSGKTEVGASAAASHTGTLAGSDSAYQAAFEQSGVIRVDTIEELFDFGSILAQQSPPESRKVGILTNAGGPGVMAADALEKYGLELAELEEETLEGLGKVLSALASRKNPIDLTGKANEEDYRKALDYVIEDDNVGSVLAMSAPAAIFSYPQLAEILAEAREKTDKPIVGTLMGGKLPDAAAESLKEAGVPNYFDPDRAVRALSALVDYGDVSKKKVTSPDQVLPEEVDLEAEVRALAERADGMIGLEGLGLLSRLGIPVVESWVARSADEAAAIAGELSAQLVLKVESPDITHKSDLGGVKVGVDPEEVTVEYEELLETVRENSGSSNLRLEGVRIQEMVKGEEVIVGVNRDPQFGPLIMFGLGGIYVEVLKDVAFRVAPVSRPEAEKMIKSINAYPILEGVRGGPGVDVDALVDIVQKVGQLACEVPEVSELDLNPIIVDSSGPRVVDLRMRLTQ
ncbi:acetate--CoA ligase family protein [Candidatus Bipolaricaulota bacterium]|nr:acetate--CoA ligase family protein [Candidatus Bipolaricaulota bacterium]